MFRNLNPFPLLNLPVYCLPTALNLRVDPVYGDLLPHSNVVIEYGLLESSGPSPHHSAHEYGLRRP